MKTKKKPSPAQEFLDALTDVIADRVAAKVVEAGKPPPMPEKVPLWLSGPPLPRPKRPPIEGKWTVEQALRNAGMLTHGDPGYREALDKYLDWKRRHDAELRARAQMRKAARLLEKLLDRVSP